MTNKYKGMTDYGVATQDILDFAEEVGLDPMKVWKKVIDKFVENGAIEYEGYTPDDAVPSYCRGWSDWDYVKVLDKGLTYHSNDNPETLVTVKELLAGCCDTAEDGVADNHYPLPIVVRIPQQEVIKFIGDNPTMTFSFKRLNESKDMWKGFDGYGEDGLHLVQVYFKGEMAI